MVNIYRYGRVSRPSRRFSSQIPWKDRAIRVIQEARKLGPIVGNADVTLKAEKLEQKEQNRLFIGVYIFKRFRSEYGHRSSYLEGGGDVTV